MSNIYDQDLDKNAANFVALSPVSFVERSAEVFATCRRWCTVRASTAGARPATALRAWRPRCARSGWGAVPPSASCCPTRRDMIEAHYAVPALNAVLNTLNTRLDAPLLAWQMNHCEAEVLITDREFAPVLQAALAMLRDEHGRAPLVIEVLRQRVRAARASASARRVRGAAGRACAAGAARGPGRRVGCDRRVLHLGHDRRPEGRRDPPPRRVSQRGVQRGDLDDAAFPALPVDAADVPLQRLVLPVDGGAARRHARLPAPGRGARRSSTRSASTASITTAPRRSCTTCSSPRRAELRAGITQQGARAWSPARRRRPR